MGVFDDQVHVRGRKEVPSPDHRLDGVPRRGLGGCRRHIYMCWRKPKYVVVLVEYEDESDDDDDDDFIWQVHQHQGQHWPQPPSMKKCYRVNQI